MIETIARLFSRRPVVTVAAWCDLHDRPQCEHVGKYPRDVIGVYFGRTYYADGSSADVPPCRCEWVGAKVR